LIIEFLNLKTPDFFILLLFILDPFI